MKRNDKDAAQKQYWKDRERTAELINAMIFRGEEVVSAERITDRNSEVIGMYPQKSGKKSIRRLADIAKQVDVGNTRLLIYLENQEKIDYAMPKRSLMLEAACYQEQYVGIQSGHSRKKDLKEDEFLCGFSKCDRLQPIISIVLYYGEKPWDGATALHDILSLPENIPGIGSAVNNNQIILLDVRRYAGTENFKTDLRETFAFIRYSSDKEKLRAYVEENEEVFGNLREDAYDFLAFTTGSDEIMKVKEKTKTKTGGHNVCKAIQGMIDDGIAKGMQMGIEQGQRIGESRDNGLIQAVFSDKQKSF